MKSMLMLVCVVAKEKLSIVTHNSLIIAKALVVTQGVPEISSVKKNFIII